MIDRTIGDGVAPAAGMAPSATFGHSSTMLGRLERAGETVTVTLEGEFDMAVVPDFLDAMTGVEAEAPMTVVVDLGGVTFIDSSGINAMLVERERAAGRHALIVRAGSGPVRRAFELAGVDGLFTA